MYIDGHSEASLTAKTIGDNRSLLDQGFSYAALPQGLPHLQIGIGAYFYHLGEVEIEIGADCLQRTR